MSKHILKLVRHFRNLVGQCPINYRLLDPALLTNGENRGGRGRSGGGGGGFMHGVKCLTCIPWGGSSCVCVGGGGGVFMGYNALPVYPGEVPPVCACGGGGGAGREYSWGIMHYLYTLGRFLLCVRVGGGGGGEYSWGIMPYLYTLGRFLLCVCGGGGAGGVFMGYNALPVHPGKVPPVCVGGGGRGGIHGV